MKKNITVYSYNISNLNNADRVRFVYFIKGRNGHPGKIKELGGKFIAPACFFVPSKESKEIDKTMKEWNVKYKKYDMLMY